MCGLYSYHVCCIAAPWLAKFKTSQRRNAKHRLRWLMNYLYLPFWFLVLEVRLDTLYVIALCQELFRRTWLEFACEAALGHKFTFVLMRHLNLGLNPLQACLKISWSLSFRVNTEWATASNSRQIKWVFGPFLDETRIDERVLDHLLVNLKFNFVYFQRHVHRWLPDQDVSGQLTVQLFGYLATLRVLCAAELLEGS